VVMSEIKQEVREFYNQVGWQEVSEGVYQNARYEDLRPVSRAYIERCHMRVAEHLTHRGDICSMRAAVRSSTRPTWNTRAVTTPGVRRYLDRSSPGSAPANWGAWHYLWWLISPTCRSSQKLSMGLCLCIRSITCHPRA
jgi:hypothetical protein